MREPSPTDCDYFGGDDDQPGNAEADSQCREQEGRIAGKMILG